MGTSPRLSSRRVTQKTTLNAVGNLLVGSEQGKVEGFASPYQPATSTTLLRAPRRCLTHTATGAVDLYSIQLRSRFESYRGTCPRSVKKHARDSEGNAVITRHAFISTRGRIRLYRKGLRKR